MTIQLATVPLLVALLSFLGLSCPVRAQPAADLNVETTLSINKLGDVPIPRSYLTLKGKTVSLYSGSAGPDYGKPSLTGVLIDLPGAPKENAQTGSPSAGSLNARLKLHGGQQNKDQPRQIIVFLGGPWLGKLDDQTSLDIVFIDGGFIRGRIAGIVKQQLLVDRNGALQDIPLPSIIDIRSPKAFYFSLTVPDTRVTVGNDCFLKPTMPSRYLESQSIRPPGSLNDDDEDMNPANSVLHGLPAMNSVSPMLIPNRMSGMGYR